MNVYCVVYVEDELNFDHGNKASSKQMEWLRKFPAIRKKKQKLNGCHFQLIGFFSAQRKNSKITYSAIIAFILLFRCGTMMQIFVIRAFQLKRDILNFELL